jgi:hypothetical protein
VFDTNKVERVAQLLVREACGATSCDGNGGGRLKVWSRGPGRAVEAESFTKHTTTN